MLIATVCSHDNVDDAAASPVCFRHVVHVVVDQVVAVDVVVDQVVVVDHVSEVYCQFRGSDRGRRHWNRYLKKRKDSNKKTNDSILEGGFLNPFIFFV